MIYFMLWKTQSLSRSPRESYPLALVWLTAVAMSTSYTFVLKSSSFSFTTVMADQQFKDNLAVQVS